jgi:hypothetical protein
MRTSGTTHWRRRWVLVMVVVLTRRQMPGARSQRWTVVRIALVIGRNHVHILNKPTSRWRVLYVRTVVSSVVMMRSLFVE